MPTNDLLATEDARSRVQRLWKTTGSPTYGIAYDEIVALQQRAVELERHLLAIIEEGEHDVFSSLFRDKIEAARAYLAENA
jgi:hypothetical protein